jgi:hypothetical protein
MVLSAQQLARVLSPIISLAQSLSLSAKFDSRRHLE